MVLQTFDPDDSPLALLRLARSEAELELRKSLAKASMLALTLAVSFLLARAFLFAPPDVIIRDVPIWIPDPTILLPPPTPVGNPAPPRAAPPDTRGAVQPVEQDAQTEPARMVPPAGPLTNGPATNGPVGNDAPVRGPEVVAPPVEPKPTDFVIYEKLPMPEHQVKPDYPPIAQQAGMEGKVLVRMLIGPDGRVRKAEIEKSSPMFDEYALDAARQWTFTPALTDGKPVMAWVRIPFDFRLH